MPSCPAPKLHGLTAPSSTWSCSCWPPAPWPSSEDEIALRDADGKTKPISTDLLAQLMKLMIDNVRLVVFNTCQSRKHAEAIAAHVDVAIGMTASIDDEAARVFAAQLYSAIGFGRSVQQAFEQARLELQLEGLPGADIPELFARAGVDPNQVFLVRP